MTPGDSTRDPLRAAFDAIKGLPPSPPTTPPAFEALRRELARKARQVFDAPEPLSLESRSRLEGLLADLRRKAGGGWMGYQLDAEAVAAALELDDRLRELAEGGPR